MNVGATCGLGAKLDYVAMKRPLLVWMGLAGVVCLATRAAGAPQSVYERFTLGCLFRVIIDDSGPKAKEAAGEAFAIADKINDACSDQMADAQVQAFCRREHGKPHEVGPGFFEALTSARQLAEATGGRFDPTIGPLTRLWREARRSGRPPSVEAVAKAREAIGWRHLVLDADKRTAMLEKDGMTLDFGAIARGFAADKMLELLARKGFPRAIVRAGDDIRVGDPPNGAEAWRIRVSLREPGGPSQIVIPLCKAAVSTVGGLRQSVVIGGTRYSEILDPATGLGLTEPIAATVIADTATKSSALATACCVAGPEMAKEALAAWGGRAARVVHRDDGKRVVTRVGEFPGDRTNDNQSAR